MNNKEKKAKELDPRINTTMFDRDDNCVNVTQEEINAKAK